MLTYDCKLLVFGPYIVRVVLFNTNKYVYFDRKMRFFLFPPIQLAYNFVVLKKITHEDLSTSIVFREGSLES